MVKKYVGLFIPLPPELGNQFPSLAPKDKSPPHATFLFVGDVPPGREGEFLTVVRGAFAGSGLRPPVRATLDRPEYFNSPNDGRVAVLRVLFNQDMARFRNRVLRALQAADFPIKDSFPYVYRPHVTLGYLGDGEDFTGKVPSGSWEFDQIEVWGLGDYVWGGGGQDYIMRISRTVSRTALSKVVRDRDVLVRDPKSGLLFEQSKIIRGHGLPNEVVFVDAQRLWTDFQRNKSQAIDLETGKGVIKGRPERTQRFLEAIKGKGIPVEMPEVYLQGDAVTFEDGRHRFAVLLRLGQKVMPVSVEKGGAKAVAVKYGKNPSGWEEIGPADRSALRTRSKPLLKEVVREERERARANRIASRWLARRSG